MGAIGYGQDVYPAGSTAAKDSVFDNTGTDLESTNTEDAIKEVNAKVGDTDISDIGDGTATGAISELNSNLSSYFTVEVRTSTVSMGANANGSASFNVTKTDYTPILATFVDNSDLNIAYQKCMIVGNNVEVNIRNLNGVAITPTVSVAVLYKKTI